MTARCSYKKILSEISVLLNLYLVLLSVKYILIYSKLINGDININATIIRLMIIFLPIVGYATVLRFRADACWCSVYREENERRKKGKRKREVRVKGSL